eukprot:gene20250-biopygen23548
MVYPKRRIHLPPEAPLTRLRRFVWRSLIKGTLHPDSRLVQRIRPYFCSSLSAHDCHILLHRFATIRGMSHVPGPGCLRATTQKWGHPSCTDCCVT